ncbi:S1 family peptidase [Rhodococcus qingshengii]|uniref:S1 family peptidase n=1 Tax=Rhodococcus qingshengii TaxID=334542 RepID=UPI002112638C|nr:S1 family peptidase [Rhodococcus qingshengii]UUE25888.1 S1 family peptidase [Rhodococcus qingshengii]
MRKLYGLLACLAVFLGAFLANAPAASAATGIVSNGIGWTPFEFPTASPIPGAREDCTLGVVGTDSSGNKIAISAAHCVSQDWNYKTDGATVYRMAPTGPRQAIGTIAYRSANATGYPVPATSTDPNAYGVDFVVIKLNADAGLSSNGPGARIDGIGVANPGGVHCKDGVGTGVRCGFITDNTPPTRFYSTALSGGGDSGGPAFQNDTKLVGLVRGGGPFTYEYIKFSAVQAEIAAQSNPVGKGLAVTNN